MCYDIPSVLCLDIRIFLIECSLDGASVVVIAAWVVIFLISLQNRLFQGVRFMLILEAKSLEGFEGEEEHNACTNKAHAG